MNVQVNNNFIVMSRDEFRPWLQQQKITRSITRLQVHHTWSPAYKDFKDGDEFKRLEAMRNYHLSQGWNAIGQNITTFPNGKIGISLGRNLNVTPAGIKGANTGALCIENLGNFNIGGDNMTTAHRDTIVHLYATLAEKLHLPIDTSHIVYHAWYTPDGDRLGDYDPKRSSKTCPGTAFFGGNTITAAAQYFLPLVQAELNKLKGVTPAAINEEDQPMTAEEKKQFEELQNTVKTQSEVIQKLSDRLNLNSDQKYASSYKDAVEAAKAAGAIKTSADKSKPELNIIQMIYNMGLFEEGAKH